MNSNECKYGFFDLNNQEYVITTPYTPKAWINYLGGTGDIDAFISNRAGGTAWYKQPQSGRLTRYQYTALPEDRSGFYLYIRTKDGTVWNPSCTPTCTKLDKYKCCHGTYYTRFDSEKNGLQAQIKYFIPRQDAVLLWDVVLTNNSDQEQEFSIYPYMDFSMRDVLKDVLYYHFTGNQMGGFYDEKHNALVLDYCAFEAQYPGYTLLNASKPFTAYEMSRDVFIGRCRSESNPAAMENGDLSNSEIPGGGFPICGVFKLDFKLAPGASERVIIKLAVDSKLENAAKLLEKYNDFAAVDSAAADFENWWQKALGKNQIATPDEALNAMLNTWFPKNIKTTMRCGRAISHRHTGTRPSTSFRDTMQDIMSGVTFFPEETREKILILMHSVRANGQLVKHIDPQNFTCSMPEHNRCDAIVWGIFTIAKYIAETGDKAILNTVVADYEGTPATVLELLLRAMKHTGNATGANGLPKLFDCDWNDALVVITAVYNNGESIMLGMQYIVAAKILIGMLDDKYADDIAFFEQKIKDFTAILDSDAVWDGDWYRRLLFDEAVIGSKQNKEGSIFLNTQTWAALAGTLDPEHTRKAMDSVYEKLHTKYGIQIQTPPFTRLMNGDRYSGNFAGAGENAGLFYHANIWAIIAEAVMGNQQRAWEYFNNVRPDCRAAADIDLYEREPYAFASWLYGPTNASFGKASLTHLTGGASWVYHAATVYLLGVQPEINGVRIKPCIPAEWDGYTFNREIAGVNYRIKVSNPQHKTGPEVKIKVNGTPIEGNFVKHGAKGETVEVDVTIV